MNRVRTLVALVAFSLLAVTACDGCNGCSSDDRLEADADERVTELASRLPATADAAVVIPELRDLPEFLDYVFARAEHFDPDARATENRVNQLMGLRISDIESWDAAGFAPDSSMIFSTVGSRPVMAGFIDDKNAFETHFIGRMRNQTDTGTPIQSNTIGDRDFRESGNPPMSDMAWYYDDSIVVLIFPPLQDLEVFSSGSAASVANKLGSVDDDTSLASTDAFTEFRRGVGDHYPVSLYLHADHYFDRPEVNDDNFGMGGLGAIMEGLLEWSRSNAEGTGIGFRAGDQRLELRAFAGGEEELIEEARSAYATDDETDWGGMLTENTTLAARTSFDLSSVVDSYLDRLSDEERQRAERELSLLGQDYGLDFNEDVVGALSGQSLLVFYGVGGDIDSAVQPFMQGRIFNGLRIAMANSGLLFNLHFSDAEKMERLFDAATEARGELFERRAVVVDGEPVEDIEVFEPGDLSLMPLRLFTSDHSATFATSGIGESAAYQYLTDGREEARLADVEGLSLGNEFAGPDGLNGLYVNFGNIRSNMRNIPFAAGYANAIRMVHELLITAGVDDNGFYLSAQLDFTDSLETDGDQ